MPRPQRPVSDNQRAANRANAAHSTGPRSPEGKARSARNARKHGFTASTFAVVRLEDLQEIANLKSDLVSVYQPVNSQELFAIERLALSQQAILRLARLESGLLTVSLNETLDAKDRPMFPMNDVLAGDGDIEITRAQNRNFLLAEGFQRMARWSNCWQLFLRYQAQTDRHYRRAVEEFERLRALRPSLPPELPNEPILEVQPEPTEELYRAKTNPIPPPGSAPQPPAPAPVSGKAPEHAAESPVGRSERGSALSRPAGRPLGPVSGLPGSVSHPHPGAPDAPTHPQVTPGRPASPPLPPIASRATSAPDHPLPDSHA